VRPGTSIAIGALVIGFGLAGSAKAQGKPAAPECFDALVIASAIRQTPTRTPDCGGDCLVMRWPWILQLDVERVLRGTAPVGPVTVLSVQHTYWKVDHGGLPWRLRRNAYGGFNALTYGAKTPAVLCPSDAPPVAPLVKLNTGQKLDDLIAEGERIHGRGPKECCLANHWTGRLKMWMRDRQRPSF
jgi:hypothetical protein